MAQVRLTPGYFRTARRLAPAGTTTARKLAECLRSLEQDPIPTTDDVEDFMPPVLRCWSRRVSGTALVVMFRVVDPDVVVLAVKVVGTT